VDGSRGIARRTAPFVLTGAVALAGCGGGTRQDANEPSASFKVDVVDASFPAKQHLSTPERLRIAVKNTGDQDVPDVAVTVDSFSEVSQEQGVADPQRPVWLVDAAPRGGTTAYVNTWALGRLRPGQTRTFTWRVTAIEPGQHKVRWSVSAGLNGKAKARLNDNRVPEGEFTVNVTPKPSQASVDPSTGKVVRSSN
jgi:hypothetical protein